MSLTTVSHVPNLNNDTFRGFLEDNDIVVVGFVLPWIESYERFAREYDEAARIMHGSGVQFAKVDCTKERELCKQFEFSRYPTINLFQGLDNVKLYEGSWRPSDIVSYAKRQSLPTISIVTADSLQDFKSTSNVAVVGYFAPDDGVSYEAFRSVAEAMHEDYLFGVTNDDMLAKAEQISVPGIALYKNFDEGKNVFELTHDSQDITSFVKAAGRPLVVEFLPELHASYVAAGIPLGYVFVEASKVQALLSETVEPLAKKFKDRIQFGTVDVKIFDSLADDLHLKLDEWPAFALREPVKNQRFPLNQCQKLSKQELDTSVQNFFDGKLMPTIKSEPVPKTQQGPVTVIVGHSFEDLVLNNDKDVLVEYYTQSCGPCKVFASTYEKLAKLYAANATSNDRVTIAKMDEEANDAPDNIRCFPKFKLFPAGSKESPVLYGGSRTIEGMADFIRDNGKHKVELHLKDNMNEQKVLHEK